MRIEDKIVSFEYLLSKLISWYEDLVGEEIDYSYNDFNQLKVLKLLFFTSAVKASPTTDGLLHIFNNFYAMPYGHVESDVYKNITELNNFYVSRAGTNRINNELNFAGLSNENKIKINESILALKSKNERIVCASPLDLVDLSHQWFSWKQTFNYAKSLDKRSERIPTEIIKQEPKFFSL